MFINWSSIILTFKCTLPVHFSLSPIILLIFSFSLCSHATFLAISSFGARSKSVGLLYIPSYPYIGYFHQRLSTLRDIHLCILCNTLARTDKCNFSIGVSAIFHHHSFEIRSKTMDNCIKTSYHNIREITIGRDDFYWESVKVSNLTITILFFTP